MHDTLFVPSCRFRSFSKKKRKTEREKIFIDCNWIKCWVYDPFLAYFPLHSSRLYCLEILLIYFHLALLLNACILTSIYSRRRRRWRNISLKGSRFPLAFFHYTQLILINAEKNSLFLNLDTKTLQLNIKHNSHVIQLIKLRKS